MQTPTHGRQVCRCARLILKYGILRWQSMPSICSNKMYEKCTNSWNSWNLVPSASCKHYSRRNSYDVVVTGTSWDGRHVSVFDKNVIVSVCFFHRRWVTVEFVYGGICCAHCRNKSRPNPDERMRFSFFAEWRNRQLLMNFYSSRNLVWNCAQCLCVE